MSLTSSINYVANSSLGRYAGIVQPLASEVAGALYPLTKQPIAYASSMGSLLVTLASDKSPAEKVWNVTQNAATCAVTYFQARTAFIAQTSLNFAASVVDVVKDASQLATTKGAGKLCKCASAALALVAMASWDQKDCLKLTAVSLLLQGAGSLFQAKEELDKIPDDGIPIYAHILDVAVKTVMGVIYCVKANSVRQELNRLQQAVQEVVGKYFVMMRVAPHDKEGRLTNEGIARLWNASKFLEEMRKKTNRSTEVCILRYHKERGSEETEDQLGDFLLDYMGVEAVSMTGAPELQGTNNRQLQKTHPELCQEFKALPREEQFGSKPPVEGYESGQEVYERVSRVVEKVLKDDGRKNLVIFITDQEAMLNYSYGLLQSGAAIPADWGAHHATSCEIYPMVQNPDGMISSYGDRFRPTTE